MTKSRQTGAETLHKGLTVLEAVERTGHPASITEIAEATGIQRLAVYRLLRALEDRGYVRRSPDKRYSVTARRRRILVGYAAPLEGNTFRIDVAASLREAAGRAGVDAVELDNRDDDPEQALRSAQTLIDARVDVAIIFQPTEAIGHMLADRFFAAKLPFITVERPIHGGVYFGANNYQAGKMAGAVLAAWARDKWRGAFDRIVLLEGVRTSTNVQARLAGVLVGVRDVLGGVDESLVVHVEGRAHQEASRAGMADLLRSLPRHARLLVSGFNDLSALGALDAVRAARRERDVAIVGHNAMAEGRAEIRKRGSPFIASIAYFPERYGPRLISLACDIAAGEQVPPAAYTDHVVIDRSNVERLYPRTLTAAAP